MFPPPCIIPLVLVQRLTQSSYSSGTLLYGSSLIFHSSQYVGRHFSSVPHHRRPYHGCFIWLGPQSLYLTLLLLINIPRLTPNDIFQKLNNIKSLGLIDTCSGYHHTSHLHANLAGTDTGDKLTTYSMIYQICLA